MFLLNTMQALDFAATESSGDRPWVLAWIFFGVIVFTTFLMYMFGEDGVVVLVGIFVGGFAFAVTMFIGGGGEGYTAEQKNELQSWASETYLIDVSKSQANDLLEYQVDLKDSKPGEVNENAITVKDSYGKTVSVTLVQDGKNYVLVQSGSELPGATKGE